MSTKARDEEGLIGTPITVTLNGEQKQRLENRVRSGKAERCLVDRTKIILRFASGYPGNTIAKQVGVTPAVVTKWRKRFVLDGIEGLCDLAHSGKPARYDGDTEKRILAVLDKDPPKGLPVGTDRLWQGNWGMPVSTRYGEFLGTRE